MDFELTASIIGLGETLKARRLFLATAESCTGGLIAGALTSVSGSSDWFLGGVVAYANEVKRDVLGVPEEALAAHGAVSEPVVLAMAEGAARVLGARCAVSVSGVAGPTGGTPDKPVGTVWMGCTVGRGARARLLRLSGTRDEIRAATVREAVAWLREMLEEDAT